MDNGDESNSPFPQAAGADGEPLRIPEHEAGRTLLATRLLVGLLASGSGELVQRLEELQEEVLADPGLGRRDVSPGGTPSRDALRYLVIGLLIEGQKQVSSSVRSGRNLSAGTARRIVRGLDRLTDNRLARPVRRSVAARVRAWDQRIAILIEKGSIEEQRSKVLAAESLGMIVDEVTDYVAENPEIDRLIAEIVGQKSVGLATIMADNARSLTATADEVADGALRRLLRRTPRRALPPSPIEGQLQTMYTPTTQVEGADDDER